MSPCLNTAQMALRRFRPICAGEIPGAWRKFGGFGKPLRLLSTYPDSRIEDNTKVAARYADEERRLPAHTACSRVDPRQVSHLIMWPVRDRRLRVVGEQGRSYQLRRPQDGNTRKRRRNPPPSRRRSKDKSRGHASTNARDRRYRKNRPSGPRAYGASSANE